MTREKIILIGSGGHANSCIDVIHSINKYKISGYVDDKINDICPLKYLGNDKDLTKLRKTYENAFIGIGFIKSPKIRIKLIKILDINLYKVPTLISSRSYLAKKSKIRSGTIVHHNCLVNANVSIGKFNIINTNALIEHDVTIGENNHISTGVIVNGNTKIGNNNFIGSGTIIYNNIIIGNNCTIAAGSIIKKNLLSNTFVNK